MLKGIKKLAVFVDGHEAFPECVMRYLRWFDRCADQGRLSKREFVEPLRVPQLPEMRGLHRIFCPLPGEEWRIDAMIALEWRPGPWSAEREREREYGTLLGYAEWQNDVWAEVFPCAG